MNEATITANGDEVILNGRKFRRKMRWYELQLIRTAGLSAQFQGTILIDPGPGPFLLTRLHADDTADGVALGSQEPWLMQIQDNENGYLWADAQAPRAALFGDRILGYQPPDLTALKPNSRITFTLTNRAAGAVAGTATISLCGWSLIPVQ